MIYVIITTSIHNKIPPFNNEHRKNRYIDSIQHLLNLIKNNPNIHPIIVENNGQRTTFLDSLNCDVLYTDNNRIQCKHKGGNELLDIKEVIHKYNIDDNDTIIKLTGRYKLMNLDFIHLVSQNNYDAFVKFFNVYTKKKHSNMDDCVLGLFAIKCKYLKQFNYSYETSAEVDFANYVKKYVDKKMSVEHLELECCLADNLQILIV